MKTVKELEEERKRLEKKLSKIDSQITKAKAPKPIGFNYKGKQ